MTDSKPTIFGETPDGAAVRAFDISEGELSARIIEWGAVLQDLRLEGLAHPLVIGLPTLSDYLVDDQHIGAVVGRVANRLSGGRFVVDGQEGFATRNIGGHTTLHGGEKGWGRRLWRAVEADRRSVTLALTDPDGAEGFPGEVEVRCTYSLSSMALEIRLEARALSPTVVNMTHHAYFNLSGEASINKHRLSIKADRLTPLGADMTPTGEIIAVSGGTDWRTLREIGEQEIDVNYVLADKMLEAPQPAALVVADEVAMSISTTTPGMQVYTGDNLTGAALATNGHRTFPRSGFCLETQFWPDAPNNSNFPKISCSANQVIVSTTKYFFERRG